MPYIISRASQSTEYTSWAKGRNGENKRLKSVLIKGGANVVDKKTLETPAGVITEVSAEDLKFLQSHSAFKRHVAAGWLSIEKTKGAADKKSEIVQKDKDGYVEKDGSAQLLPEDFEKAGQKPPKVGGEE